MRRDYRGSRDMRGNSGASDFEAPTLKNMKYRRENDTR
jgi:hypothetical protein